VVSFRIFAHHHNYFYTDSRLEQVFQRECVVVDVLSGSFSHHTSEYGVEKGTNTLVGHKVLGGTEIGGVP